jgi:hypothetical protein
MGASPLPHSTHRQQLESLWNKIVRSFPPTLPDAPILAGGDEIPTPSGHNANPLPPSPPDHQDLLRSLKDQRWDHLSPEFVERHLGDFVLLSAPAFAAYIPAWLLFSLGHTLQGAEFIAYTFTPDEMQSSSRIRSLSVEMFRALDPTQRRVLRDFLIYTAEFHPSDYVADHAAAAVDAISDLIAIFEPDASQS